jgi:cytochrome o ubiquinol oxidase subunit II
MLPKIPRVLHLAPLAILLCSCKMVVMQPSGDVAVQQRDLIVVSTILMLLIIVPVIALTLFFAWRYRQSNAVATYDPEWHHSTRLEVIIWAAPLTIIVALGALTWVGSHLLDPYRPIDRIDASHPLTAATTPLKVDVVALDWKWLFIYPDQGIATVNELAAPVNAPIDFQITASSVMNSFSIPALAGQVYAMPGMVTQLHAVINAPGVYDGFSANYSGAGFSDMQFKFYGMSQADFDRWVMVAKTSGGGALSRKEYLSLAQPSQKVPVHRYATIDAHLYQAVADQCVDPGQMCMSEMRHVDAQGGLGLAGVYGVGTRADAQPLAPGGHRPQQKYVLAFCTPAEPTGRPPQPQLR